MKLIFEGNQKKVTQIKKELTNRCKRDNIHISEILEENESYNPEFQKKIIDFPALDEVDSINDDTEAVYKKIAKIAKKGVKNRD